MGLSYLRAYYDLSTGRFVSRDRFPGNPIIPLSTQLYLYAQANPVNGNDPSGQCLVSSNLLWGNIVHEDIGLDFQRSGLDRWYDVNIRWYLSDWNIPWAVGRSRPDLTDRPDAKLFEIKPFGLYFAGLEQLLFYIGILDTFDDEHRNWDVGTPSTYTPPPESSWSPGPPMRSSARRSSGSFSINAAISD